MPIDIIFLNRDINKISWLITVIFSNYYLTKFFFILYYLFIFFGLITEFIPKKKRKTFSREIVMAHNCDNFLVNSEIKRIGTKKKAPNMGGMLEVFRNIHFDPLTLKIT